ncbi:MAG: hypothetical protein Kow0010_21590 [Dehalococcoidia bacterium]
MVPRKLVEIAWRKAWLLVLPIVLVPVAAFAFAPSRVEYESVATVWVSPAPDLDPGALARNTGGELDPAENQAEILKDLLGTRSYREAVAMAAWSLSAAEAAGAELRVAESVSVHAVGRNLLEIRASAPVANDAQALVAAVIAEYRERASAQAAMEAEARLNVAQRRFDSAVAEYDRREQARAEYLAANPTAATTGDVAYQALLTRVNNQAVTVDRLRTELDDAQNAVSTAELAQQLVFNVQDHPTLPEAPVAASLVERAMLPGAGLVLGVALSAGLLLVMYRTDHTVRSSEDLRGLSAPLLGRIPELRRRGVARALPGGRTYARRLAASITVAQKEGS